MPPQPLQPLQRISPLLRLLVCLVLFLLSLLFLASSSAVLIGRGVTLALPDARILIEPLALPVRLLLVAFLFLALGVPAKGLYHLQKLLDHFARGQILTAESATSASPASSASA
jgi:hypothetical protein